MSTPFAGFCGPSYYFTNKYAAIEDCINWYVVPVESAGAKSQMALSPSPCNAAFSVLPVPAPFNLPNRGLLELRGRVFGVNGTQCFELKSDGTYVLIGSVNSDDKPATMYANGNGQIFVGSAKKGYVIPPNPLPGSLISLGVNPDFLGVSRGTFQDGYGLNIVPGTNEFQISGSSVTPLGDFTVWDAANIAVLAGQADLPQSILSSHEYIYILGSRRSQIFYNAGNQGQGGFPFVSYSDTFMETGISAPATLTELGDSVAWCGQDDRGQRAAWRSETRFQPQRISNFCVEQDWQSYYRVDDAASFAFIWRGHLLWQTTFPSAIKLDSGQLLGRTWVYDATASAVLQRPMWHKRSYQTYDGFVQQRPEMFHCFAFGKHLVGSNGVDGNPGAIYQYSDTTSIDSTPNPQLLLRWSNDGGETYGLEYNLPTGTVGEFSKRVYLNRCGYGRDRVFWVRCTDFGTDCGRDGSGNQIQQQVVRDRICPHLWVNNKRILFNRIEFEVYRGTGNIGIVAAELDVAELAS